MRMNKPLERVKKLAPKRVPRGLPTGLRRTLFELWALLREMVRIPAQLFMRLAELAGGIVLAGWLVVWPLLVRFWRAAGVARIIAQNIITPARAALVVAAAASIGLVASQFADYSSISISTDSYAGVEAVAAAPQVESSSAGSAHLWIGIPLGVLALAVVAASVRRWQAARLLPSIGIAVVAVSLLVDRPKGLDEGTAAIAYEGVQASLLGGFWAQLVCGVVLIVSAPLITRHMRAYRSGERRPVDGARRSLRLRPPPWRTSRAGT